MKKVPTLITSVKLSDKDIRTMIYWAYNVWQTKGYLLDADRELLQTLLVEVVNRDCLCREELDKLRRMILTK